MLSTLLGGDANSNRTSKELPEHGETLSHISVGGPFRPNCPKSRGSAAAQLHFSSLQNCKPESGLGPKVRGRGFPTCREIAKNESAAFDLGESHKEGWSKGGGRSLRLLSNKKGTRRNSKRTTNDQPPCTWPSLGFHLGVSYKIGWAAASCTAKDKNIPDGDEPLTFGVFFTQKPRERPPLGIPITKPHIFETKQIPRAIVPLVHFAKGC